MRKSQNAESLINKLRSVLLMAEHRDGRLEKFEIDMLKDAIASYAAPRHKTILAADPLPAPQAGVVGDNNPRR